MADPNEERTSLVADGTLGLAELTRKRENVTQCKPQLSDRLARLEELQAELQGRVQQVEAAEKELDQRTRLSEIEKRLTGLESRDVVTAQSEASPEEQIAPSKPDSSSQTKENKSRDRKSSKLSTACFKGEKDKESTDSRQDIQGTQEPSKPLQDNQSMQNSPKKVSKRMSCLGDKQKEKDEEPQDKSCLSKQKPKKGSLTVKKDDDTHQDMNTQVNPSDGEKQRLSDTPGEGVQPQHTAEETSELLPEQEAEKVPVEPPPTAETQGEGVSKEQPAAKVSCRRDIPNDQQAKQVPIESPPTADTPGEEVSKQQPTAEASCRCDIPNDQQAKQVPIEPPPTADTPGEEVSKQQPTAEASCRCDIPNDQQAKQVPIEPPPTADTPGEGVSKQQPAAEDSCDCEIPTNEQAKQVPIEPPPTADTPDEGVPKQQPAAEDSCDCEIPTNEQAKQVPIQSPPTTDTPCGGVTKQQPPAKDDSEIPTDQKTQHLPMEPQPTADTPCEGAIPKIPTSQCMPDNTQPSPGTCGMMDGVVICPCGCGTVIPALPRMGTSPCGCSFQCPDVEAKPKPNRASRASRRTSAEPRSHSRRLSPNSQYKVPRKSFVPDASNCEPDRVQNLLPRPPPNVAPQQCPTSPVKPAITPDVFDCGGRFPMTNPSMSVDNKQRLPFETPMQPQSTGNTVTFQRQWFAPMGAANESRYPRRSNRDSRRFSKSRSQTIPEPSRPSTQARPSTYRRFDSTQAGRPSVFSDSGFHCRPPQESQSNQFASPDVPPDFSTCSPNQARSTQTPTAENRSLETCGTKGRSQSVPAFAPTLPQTSTGASFAEPAGEPPSSLPSGACSMGSVPQRSSVAPNNGRPCARKVPTSSPDNFVGPIDTQPPQDRGPSENTCGSSCHSKPPDRSQSLSTFSSPEFPPDAIASPDSSASPDHSLDNPSPPMNDPETQPLQTPTSTCASCRNKPRETCSVSTSFSNPMMHPPQSQNGGSPPDSDPFQGSPQISGGVCAPPSRAPAATKDSLSPDTTSVPSPPCSESAPRPSEPTAFPRPGRPSALRSQSVEPSDFPSPYTRSSSPAANGCSTPGCTTDASPAPRPSAVPFADRNASMYGGRPSQNPPTPSRRSDPTRASQQADPTATDASAALRMPCSMTPDAGAQELPSRRPSKNSGSVSYSRQSRSSSDPVFGNSTSCCPAPAQPGTWGSYSESSSDQYPMQSQSQRPSESQNPCASTCGSPMTSGESGPDPPYGSVYHHDACPSLAAPENHAPDGTFSCSHQCPAVAGTAPCPSLSPSVPENFPNASASPPLPDRFYPSYTPRCTHRSHSVRRYWDRNYRHPRCPNKLNTNSSPCPQRAHTRQAQDQCTQSRYRRPFL